MAALICEIRDHVALASFSRSELTEHEIIEEVSVRLSQLIGRGDIQGLLINFQGVKLMTSEMIGQLVSLRKRCIAENVNLKLCNLSEIILHVLKLVRLDNVFHVYRNLPAALAACRRDRVFGAAQAKLQSHEDWGSAELHRSAAEEGNADAQFKLGRCYDNALGVEQNHVEALQWYRRAALQQHTDALGAVAYCYAFGMGVTKDYDEAIKFYRQAADQGLAEAQYMLGLSYDCGLCVPTDPQQAANWYRLAAAQGDVRAQEALTPIK